MRFIDSARNNSLLWTGVTFLLLNLLAGASVSVNAQLPPSPPKPSPELPTPNTDIEQPPTQIDREPTIDTSPEQWRTIELVGPIGDQEGTVDAIVFSPDNQYILGGGYREQPNIKVWELEGGRRRANIRAQRRGVQALVIDPLGQNLVSAGEDGGINFWNWPDGEYIGIAVNHRTHVMALAISPDSQILVSGGLDGIKVWTLCDRRPLYTLTRLGNPSYAIGMNPNGTIIASGDDQGKIQFWDIRKGVFLSEFTAHEEVITGVLYTPDGRRLITSSEDRTIRVWDVQSKRLLYTFIGHSNQIRSIALHPNGEVLASSSNDGVRLWNVATGESLGWPERCRDWIQSVAFSPDGRYLATGGLDFEIRLWQPSTLNVKKASTELQSPK